MFEVSYDQRTSERNPFDLVGSNCEQAEQLLGALYRASPQLCRSFRPSRRCHDETQPDEGSAPGVTQKQVPSHLFGQSEIIPLDVWVENKVSGKEQTTMCAASRKID